MLKRKLSPSDVPTPDQRTEAIPAAKKRPHNVIEKRYRANLNEKIAELRDSVPSLRITKKKTKEVPDADSDEEHCRECSGRDVSGRQIFKCFLRQV